MIHTTKHSSYKTNIKVRNFYRIQPLKSAILSLGNVINNLLTLLTINVEQHFLMCKAFLCKTTIIMLNTNTTRLSKQLKNKWLRQNITRTTTTSINCKKIPKMRTAIANSSTLRTAVLQNVLICLCYLYNMYITCPAIYPSV